jgi:acetolactate synthase I/III small subunit
MPRRDPAPTVPLFGGAIHGASIRMPLLAALPTQECVMSEYHLISVLVQNKFGVLARVSALFARRGFNIISLAVAPTENDDLSRITIVVDAESASLDQVTKQLFKLVDVIKIDELDPANAVERELLIATVAADGGSRGQILDLVRIFEGKILNVGDTRITVSLDGHPSKLDDFEQLLGPYGIVEMARTGRVALPRIERQAPGAATRKAG